MAKQREVNIIVDAKNKAKGAFLEIKRDLRDLGRTAGKGLGSLSGAFSKADKVVYSFADRMKWMDKIAKRTFQGTAAAAGVYVATTLRDFSQLNDGISKVNTLYDQTAESQKKMYKDSIQMFKLIPTNFENITQGIYDTISAGADPKYASMMARKFGMGAVAGDADMATVTKAAMGTMNAFNAEVEELDRILDLQFMTVKKGITSYEELASSLGTGVLKSAEQAGITMEELYGSIAMITKNAIPATVATTALNQVFNKFTDDEVIKNFKEFGVEIQDSEKHTRPLIEILKDLNYQFDKRKMTGEQRKGFLKELVGDERATRALAPLLGDLKEFQNILDSMDDSSGAMESAFEDRLDNIRSQFKLIWNNLKSEGLEVLESFEPLLEAIVKPLKEKHRLEIDKADLEDALEFEKDAEKRKKIKDDLAKVDKKIKDIDMTPVDEFRKGLNESVKELEKINPPLAKFADILGNIALSFVGEEGQSKRKAVGYGGAGLLSLWLLPKIAKFIIGIGKGAVKDAKSVATAIQNVVDYFRVKFGKDPIWGNKTKNPSRPGETLTETLATQTMNVDANVVNVYGKSINRPGGDIPKGPTKPPVVPVLPPGGGGAKPLPKSKPIPLPDSTGLTEVMKKGAIDVAKTSAVGALKAGAPAIIAGVVTLFAERQKNLRKKRILSQPDKYSFDYLDKRYVTKGEMAKLNKQKIERDKKQGITISAKPKGMKLIDPESKKSNSFLKRIAGFLQKGQKLDLKNEVKVPKPSVHTSVYIDGKNIPVQRVENTYSGVGTYVERLMRRYGR